MIQTPVGTNDLGITHQSAIACAGSLLQELWGIKIN
jgi:hypothetical protein